jgi:hypothetical protein
MTTDMRDEIQKMIQQRVLEELKRSGVQTTPAPVEDDCKTVHTGFSCDGCGVNPIKGVRYHSMIKRNYDLCSKCEKKMHTEHPMIRLRTNTHRGLAHGRKWTELNKIITGANTARINGRCTRRGRPQHVVNPQNIFKFFTNGVMGGVNQAGKTLGEHIMEAKKATKKAEISIKKAERQNKKKRGRPTNNLCHIRTRCNPAPAPAPAPEEPKVERHSRFAEFQKVFVNADPEELNAFLEANKD